MYFADHVPPYFHTELAEHKACIPINSLAVLSGSLPPLRDVACGRVDDAASSGIAELCENARNQHRLRGSRRYYGLDAGHDTALEPTARNLSWRAVSARTLARLVVVVEATDYSVSEDFLSEEANEPMVRNLYAEQFIANIDETPPDHSPAFSLTISVRADGSFVITNTRNGYSKECKSR